jgi:hypothetical protein
MLALLGFSPLPPPLRCCLQEISQGLIDAVVSPTISSDSE